MSKQMVPKSYNQMTKPVGHPVGCGLARLCGGRLHGGAAVVAEVGHVHVAGVDGAHRGLN